MSSFHCTVQCAVPIRNFQSAIFVRASLIILVFRTIGCSHKIFQAYVASEIYFRYGRHSKSIDTELKRCGRCKGRLELVQPANPRTPNAFALFVKENYANCKANNEGVKHAEVMTLLSQDFRKMKATD